MERHIYAVSELNGLVKALLDSVPELSGICVRGEISNYKVYPSGHHYFSLKDAQGVLRCGPAPALPAGERHEGAGYGPGHRVPPGRGLSALL